MTTLAHPLRSLRRRQIAALCVVALSFGPVLAQPAITPASAAVEAALAGWIDAFNIGLPTAAYFASDAVLVRGNGTFRGAAVIDDMEQRESKAGLRLTLKVDQVQFIGLDAAAVVSRYTVLSLAPRGRSFLASRSTCCNARATNGWSVQLASRECRHRRQPLRHRRPTLRSEAHGCSGTHNC